MKIDIFKCPVCGESFGVLETELGTKHAVLCRCDKIDRINTYIVGICLLILVIMQFEKKFNFLKKVVDTVNSFW